MPAGLTLQPTLRSPISLLVTLSGTTAAECARVLRRAGAAQVWVATAARTLKLASKYAELELDEFEGKEVEEESPVARAAGS